MTISYDESADMSFILINEEQLAQLTSFEAVIDYSMEVNNSFCSGLFSLRMLEALAVLFLGYAVIPQPTPYILTDSSQFYLVEPKLRQAIAQANYEYLMDMSVHWSKTEPWIPLKPNPFDLAGFLVELWNLCQSTVAEDDNLYVLLSERK